MIVDSHCHASSRWYEPVEILLLQMDRHRVDGAVLIQLLGAFDNRDMAAARAAHPDRIAFVAAIPPHALGRDAVLRAADAGAAGLRLRVTARAPEGEALAPWAAAAEAALAVSCVGPAVDFVGGDVGLLAETFPTLCLVLEHLGGLARPDVGDRAAIVEPVLALARWPNVRLKLPGLGQLAARRPMLDEADPPLQPDDTAALLERVVDAFGPERLMWGSDFPPVAAREGYGNALAWPRRLLAHRGPAAEAAIFGDNAAAAFGLTG